MTARPSTIPGYCPMGCGETLFSADGGHITCSALTCPRPTAADELLADHETEHIIELDDARFTVRHPLRERLDDALMECGLHRWLASRTGPPALPGRYRVLWPSEQPTFVRLNAGTAS